MQARSLEEIYVKNNPILRILRISLNNRRKSIEVEKKGYEVRIVFVLISIIRTLDNSKGLEPALCV